MITLNEVIAAYAKTGLKPVRTTALDIRNGEVCGCLLGALYCAEKGIPEITDDICEVVHKWGQSRYGDDVKSLWRGFDESVFFRTYEDTNTELYDVADSIGKKIFELYESGELYG